MLTENRRQNGTALLERADGAAAPTPAGGVDELWAEYKRSASPEARQRLIIEYSPLVKYVAGRVAAGLPHNIEQADLISYGIFGLIDAIEKFDPSRNVKFERYAVTRVKGAIIDELRSIDWVPRSVRAKARSVERAYAKLEAELLRQPTDAEVASELGISEDDLQQIFTQISLLGPRALHEVLSRPGGPGEDSTTLADTIPDRGEGPEAAFDGEEMKQILAAEISRLGDQEKTVLTLYYYEGLTLAAIGEVIGRTESRVCQIRAKAVLQLRARMGRDVSAPGGRPRAHRRFDGLVRLPAAMSAPPQAWAS